MHYSPFKHTVLWISLLIIVASLWVWNGRREQRYESALARQQIQTQRATAILFRAFHTENYLTYSAISTTKVHLGERTVESVARVVHAPQRLSIFYQSGAHAGSSGGYNQHWSWRQVASSQPVIPYAEQERSSDQVAAERFSLMLENYKAHWIGQESVAGHDADIVRLAPLHPIAGAAGPARKLWIDAKTGIILRQQNFNFTLMKVMESALDEIDFAPRITESTFVTPQRMQVAAQTQPWKARTVGNNSDRVAEISGIYPPLAQKIPRGFHFDGVGAHLCTSCESPCYAAFSRYTDGLNTLTIFALRPSCPVANAKQSNMPGTPAVSNNAVNEVEQESCEFGTGTLVMRTLPEGHLIAVADLPSIALQHVLDSTKIKTYTAAQ